MGSRVTSDAMVKISIGMLITIFGGLIAMAVAYARIDNSVNDNQSDILELKHQITKINDIHTDVAVIKSQLIEINRKLDR